MFSGLRASMRHITHLGTVTAILTLTLCMGGCVAIDSRAWKEPVAKGASQSISGLFRNSAAYSSEKMGFAGASHFSELIGFNSTPPPDTFRLSYSQIDGLTVQFETGGAKTVDKIFRPADGLNFDADGKIVLFSKNDCGVGRDLPGLGCMSKTVTLFLNPEGDLVTVQSGGGVGIVVVVPISIYAKLVAIFPKQAE